MRSSAKWIARMEETPKMKSPMMDEVANRNVAKMYEADRNVNANG